MQKSTICALGDAAVKTMDRLVPLSELTSTEGNYFLTLIDGLTMEALPLELGVWYMRGTTLRSPCPQT